jgi:hypothetical protein
MKIFFSENFDKLINTGYGQNPFSLLMCFGYLRSSYCCTVHFDNVQNSFNQQKHPLLNI